MVKVKVNYVALSQIFPARTIVLGRWGSLGGWVMVWQINREHTRRQDLTHTHTSPRKM